MDSSIKNAIQKAKSAMSKEWWDADRGDIPEDVYSRRMKVAQLWNRFGYTTRQIADTLGEKVSTISYDRRWLLEMWQSTVVADMNEIIARELAKLDEVERELWLAWEKSKEDEVIVSDETTMRHGKTSSVLKKRQVRNKPPEARFMELIIKAQDRRAKLLGIDKATSIGSATFNFAMFVEDAYRNAVQSHEQSDVIDATDVDSE